MIKIAMKANSAGINAMPQNLKLVSAFIILCCISYSLFPPKVFAHDVISESWLYVDNQDVLIYNNSLSNSQLFVAERTLKTTLSIGEQYNFTINLDEFAKEFALPKQVIKASWIVDGQEVGNGRALTLKFDKPGTHEMIVTIFDTTSSKQMFKDTLVFTVGKLPITPNIKLENRTFTSVDLGKKIIVPESAPFTFEITEPKVSYIYEWDLGGHGATVIDSQITIDPTQGIPAYILLRTTDPQGEGSYADFYLLIDNANTQNINKPAANLDLIPDVSVDNSSRLGLNTPMLVLGFLAIMFSLFGSGFYLFRRKGSNSF